MFRNYLSRMNKLMRFGGRSRYGRCLVCGRPSLFLNESDNLKESLRCWHCGGITRTRMIARALCNLYQINSLTDLPADVRVYEAQASGPIHNVLCSRRNYDCSEYIDDVVFGQVRNGIRSENLENLTYPDFNFDVVIHQSVLEHVRHPAEALSECFRVLRKGGHLIFEVPMCDYWCPTIRGKSRQRVDVSGDEDIELLPPFYHEDPLRPEGVLVYTDFGLDVGAELSSIGFDVDWLIESFSQSKMSHSVIAICNKKA